MNRLIICNFLFQIAHYLEEKLENEITITRKYKNLYTNLAQMIDLGMAVHFFDESLWCVGAL